MPEQRPDVPAGWREISYGLRGLVHLASAGHPACGIVVAVGWSPEDAQGRAQLRARALNDLRRVVPSGPGDGADSARELTLADFIADRHGPGAFRVTGEGVASGARYHLPVEVVWPGGRDCGVGAAVGVVEDPSDQIGSAITDMLAFDVVSRWWGHPQIPLLRVTKRLAETIMAAARAARLSVSAFVLPGADFQTALVSITGGDTTIGIAAGRMAASATQTAFLRALAMQVQPRDADRAHHLAWAGRASDLAWLERSALEADLTQADELAFWEGLPDWAGIASRWFGHEPIVVSAGPGGFPAKVVCPGASYYQATSRSGLMRSEG